MSTPLPLFDDSPRSAPNETPLGKMTPSQRDAIRKLFAQLGIQDAPGQFELVKEITGQRLAKVSDLEESRAHVLIHGLDNLVRTKGRANTGNAWDDREEDTWIDKL